MNKFYTLIALLGIIPLFGCSGSHSPPACPTLTSLDRTATIALHKAMDSDVDYSVGGVIFKRTDNTYCYTFPIANRSSNSIDVDVWIPIGATLVATYLTHTNVPESEKFSQWEIQNAQRLGVTAYIGVKADNTIRSFNPHTQYANIDGRTFQLHFLAKPIK